MFWDHPSILCVPIIGQVFWDHPTILLCVPITGQGDGDAHRQPDMFMGAGCWWSDRAAADHREPRRCVSERHSPHGSTSRGKGTSCTTACLCGLLYFSLYNTHFLPLIFYLKVQDRTSSNWDIYIDWPKLFTTIDIVISFFYASTII